MQVLLDRQLQRRLLNQICLTSSSNLRTVLWPFGDFQIFIKESVQIFERRISWNSFDICCSGNELASSLARLSAIECTFIEFI